MSRDISPLSYSPLKPMLYPNNGNGYSNTVLSHENNRYFNSEQSNDRGKRNTWEPSLISGSYMTRSELPQPYRDRSAEPSAVAYGYSPDRSYSSGSVHPISERHTYQYPRLNRESDSRETMSHPSMEHDSKYGPRNQFMGSGYSNSLTSYDSQRDWTTWRNESGTQVASTSSYDDSRGRPSNIEYNSSYPERPPIYGNQRDVSASWQSESSQAPSPAWNSRNYGPQRWSPKTGIRKPLKLRPFPEPPLRPKPESSYTWKPPAQEHHEGNTSSINIPAFERRRATSDTFASDSRRGNNSQVPIPIQPLPEYLNRRFQQISIPQPQPPRFEQRDRYRDTYRPPDTSRWPPSKYNPSRRPLHRISARISARPRRSPSPSESSSEASRSRSRQSLSDSPSRSRSPNHNNLRYNSNQGRHSFSGFKSSGISPSSHNDSDLYITHRKELAGEIDQSAVKSSGSNSASGLKGKQGDVRGRKRRSSSASSYHSESSIRSSVNSDPENKLDKLVPESSDRFNGPTTLSRKNSPTGSTIAPPRKEPFFPTHSQVPLSFPSIEDNLELPGMKFNTNGAPKTNETSFVLKSVEARDGNTETSQLNIIGHEPVKLPLALNEADLPQNNETSSQVEIRVDQESPRMSPKSSGMLETSIPLKNESNEDEPMDMSSSEKTNSATPSAAAMSVTESEASFPNSPTFPKPVIDPGVTISAPNQVPESSPLTDFAPLSSPVVNINEQVTRDEITTSTVENSDHPLQIKKDFPSALGYFVAGRVGNNTLPIETRYDYLFEANLTLGDAPVSRKRTTDEELVQEVMDSASFQLRLDNYPDVAQVLIERFKKRSEDFAAKTRRLQAEYKAIHVRWVANCRKLDQDLASQTVEPPSPTFRAPRRANAFGDIVRSDLELEQIIASLGNEDMTDPNVLAIRNTATIPDLNSTIPNNPDIAYFDDIGLIENPVEYFDTYSALGRWTEEEKELFLEKFGIYPKQFDVIASFLPGKTATQCIMFYYLHKKELLDFRAAVKKHGPKRKRGRKGGKGKGKGNALLADIMKPSRGQDGEDAGHRQMQQFGGMAAINGQKILSRRFLLSKGFQSNGNTMSTDNVPLNVDGSKADGNQQLPKSRSESPEEVDDSAIVVDHRPKRLVKQMDPILEADVVAVSTERPKEKVKRPPGRPPKQPKPVKDDDSGSSIPPVKVTSYVWTKNEEAQYLKLVKAHGKDFKKIAAGMPAKTELQCRNYFRKHREFESIAKEAEERLPKASRS